MSADITCAESLRTLKLPAALSEFRRQLEDPLYSSLSFSERLQMILSAQIDLQTQRRVSGHWQLHLLIGSLIMPI